MRILLLTTLPNRVHQTLAEISEVDVTVIDLSEGILKLTLCNKIEALLQRQSYDILLTYRCPYIVPENILIQFKVRLNIHPLPLPEYAGINPWNAFSNSFKIRKKQVHTVLHKMVAQPDAGEIVMQKSYEINDLQQARDIADFSASKMIEEFFLKQ